MCLAQFAASYTYNQQHENCIAEDENEFAHELDSDIPVDSDEIGHTNVIKLQNGLGKMRKRKRKAEYAGTTSTLKKNARSTTDHI